MFRMWTSFPRFIMQRPEPFTCARMCTPAAAAWRVLPCIKAENCADGFKRSIMQGPLVKCRRQAAHYRNVQSRGTRFSTFFSSFLFFFAHFVMGERFLPSCQVQFPGLWLRILDESAEANTRGARAWPSERHARAHRNMKVKDTLFVVMCRERKHFVSGCCSWRFSS